MACTSSLSRRENLEGIQDPETAVRFYQQLVTQEPDNYRAQEELIEARRRWIAKELISIRFQRMADDPEGAAERLLELIEQEKAWDLFPTGAVAFTQQEEVGLAIKYVSSQIFRALRQKHPLKASWLLKSYQAWFEKMTAQQQESILNKLTRQGQETCNELQTAAFKSRPHSHHFARLVCTAYGASLKRALPQLPKRSLHFSRLRLTINEESHLPQDFVNDLKKALLETLKATPWYKESQGEHLELKVSGVYQFKLRKQLILGPLKATQSPFAGWRYSQKMLFDLTAEGQIEHDSIFISHRRQEELTHTEDEESPAPSFMSSSKLLTQGQWRSQQLTNLSAAFFSQLQQAWGKRHCSVTEAPLSPEDLNERHFACLQLSQGFIPAHLKHWLRSRFGVSIQEVKDVLPLSPRFGPELLRQKTAKARDAIDHG